MMPEGSEQLVSKIPRRWKQALLMVLDVLLLWSSWELSEYYSGSSGSRLAFSNGLFYLGAWLCMLPIFTKRGLYRSVIRYLGEQALFAIFRAVSELVLCVGFFRLGLESFFSKSSGGGLEPLLLFAVFLCFSVTFSRFFLRWVFWYPMQQRFQGNQVLIYGARRPGQVMAESLQRGAKYFPAGFVDQDRALQGRDVAGIRVYPPEHLPELKKKFGIREVIWSFEGHDFQRDREILKLCRTLGLRLLYDPQSISKGIEQRLRDLSIEDFLGRAEVEEDPYLMKISLTGKCVLVTGAGGSIGSALCKKIIELCPKRLILLEISETALYEIHRAMLSFPETAVIPCLGSVTDERMLRDLFEEHEVHTVYHAAAYKHVPLSEDNVIATVNNNFFGTEILLRVCFEHAIERFVLVSTDKAVEPVSVMGASKRLCEILTQHYALMAHIQRKKHIFCSVRFGNVLESSGSVIPLFKEQIARGGPVTVTHPEASRYFMSIPEAASLLIQAGGLAQGGEVFVLDMGNPVNISDLARQMIFLSGADPEQVGIKYTGLRAGEKIHEKLFFSKQFEETLHPKILKSYEPHPDPDQWFSMFESLQRCLADRDASKVMELLFSMVAQETSQPAPFKNLVFLEAGAKR